MMYYLNLILSFYQKFIWISLLLNFLFLGLQVTLPLAILYKVFFSAAIYIWYSIQRNKQQLIFYNNLRISGLQLFMVCLVFDLVILLTTYFLANLLL